MGVTVKPHCDTHPEKVRGNLTSHQCISWVSQSVTVVRIHLCSLMSKRLRNRVIHTRIWSHFVYFENGSSGVDYYGDDIWTTLFHSLLLVDFTESTLAP